MHGARGLWCSMQSGCEKPACCVGGLGEKEKKAKLAGLDPLVRSVWASFGL